MLSGKQCSQCDGHLAVYHSHRSKCGKFQVQYLRCWKCKRTADSCQIKWLHSSHEPQRRIRRATVAQTSIGVADNHGTMKVPGAKRHKRNLK